VPHALNASRSSSTSKSDVSRQHDVISVRSRLRLPAEHTLWLRLLQNLRASRATDWVEKYPSHMVADELGHSPKVAAAHDPQAREHHVEDVVAGSGAGPKRSAECSAARSRRFRQEATQNARTRSHRLGYHGFFGNRASS